MKVCSTLKFGLIVLLFASVAQAQSIDISKFYYRDYLDFGQGYGAFNGENSGKANTSNGTTLTGKDGTQVSVPNVPNFSASSNYGSLTSVGRGFAVTANHVSSPESAVGLLRWGLTDYNIAKESSESGQLGYDEKFLRFNKYVVEGQVGMLDFENDVLQSNRNETQEQQNITKFKDTLNKFKDKENNIYIYQAGSGIVTLRETKNQQTFNTSGDDILKGGGFGTLGIDSIKYGCQNYQSCDKVGMWFYYYPDLSFNNRVTSGDSGSGIYAYDSTSQKWVLLGVVSKEWSGQNRAFISAVSNKDFAEYQKKFEQTIDLGGSGNNWTLEKPNGSEIQIKNNGDSQQLQGNKDMIFSGNGEINIEVKIDIDRTQSGYAGGFVFVAGDSATSENPTTYKFTNANGKTHFFKGSGLDIGENVKVEWALKGVSGDSLHKIGKGELVITTQNTATTGLGTLKIGEGKVTLDTNKKAFDNIYITSGRGELALKAGKAEALGATINNANSASSTTSATSYTLAQENTNNMGFYFGKGGGKFDLAGNSLVLNTIAANDSKAIITNSNGSATLTIEGLGYDSSGNKKTTKENTIIHASIGDTNSNIDLKYSGVSATTPSLRANEVSAAIQESSKAHLIFDGNINTSGKMEVTNGNIALQGHATTHATISNPDTIDKIKNAENGTKKGMESYMDLSKPSHLE